MFTVDEDLVEVSFSFDAADPLANGYSEDNSIDLTIQPLLVSNLQASAVCPSSDPAITTVAAGVYSDGPQCYNYGPPLTVSFTLNSVTSPTCNEVSARIWEYTVSPVTQAGVVDFSLAGP